MKIREVFRSGRFLMHLVMMVGLTLVLFWLGFRLLHTYSRHGSVYVVPDLKGLTYGEIMDNNAWDKFNIVVFDSAYDNSRPGGVVIEQDPPAGTEVKRRRTIHLTVVSKRQEMVSLPDMGNTARSARSQLEAYGLTVGKVIEVPGEYQGFLLGAYYLGNKVTEGSKIPKGGRIDLEVSVTTPIGDSLQVTDPEDDL